LILRTFHGRHELPRHPLSSIGKSGSTASNLKSESAKATHLPYSTVFAKSVPSIAANNDRRN